ncbi:ATP-grasp domain-containing protein [Yoonia maricola]|nr:ATP-grasp domain-containing protein [Yoonia maricola]
MKQPALVYVDDDFSPDGLYSFQRNHFASAKAMGWARVTLVQDSHPHPGRPEALSDETVTIRGTGVDTIISAVKALQTRYDVRLVLTYPGQCRPGSTLHDDLAAACAKLDLPQRDPKSLQCVNDKSLMRARLADRNIPSARYATVFDTGGLQQAAKDVGFPLILKPAAGTGSVLIRRCDTMEELSEHYALFCRKFAETPLTADFAGGGRIALIEECLIGIELTIECMVRGDTPHALLVNEKLHVSYEQSTVLEHLLITPPTSLSASDVSTVKRYAEDVLRAVGLRDTMVHLELFLTADGPRAVEVNPRVGGFDVPTQFRELLGIDPFETGMALMRGDVDEDTCAGILSRAEQLNDAYAMFVLYPPAPGFVTGLTGLQEAAQQEGVLHHTTHLSDDYFDISLSERFVAKFWTRVKDADHAWALYTQTCEMVRVDMATGQPRQIAGVA